MVNIDTVYQRVLVLANKEQRGYITPQEFNLFANHVQLTIFEQYFYDLNQFVRTPTNGVEYSDILELLNQKISHFKTGNVGPLPFGNGTFMLPLDLYRLGTVVWRGPFGLEADREVTEINRYKFVSANLSPLTRPDQDRPVYWKIGDAIVVRPGNIVNEIRCSYIRRPRRVEWGYVVVEEKALYNPATTQHFEMHRTEEVELVNAIAALAGISMKQPILSQQGTGLNVMKTQQEKL